MRRSTWWLLSIAVLSGCLPSSCRREEPTALLPSDSLSRQIAATVPQDTLHLRWEVAATAALPLERPRTVQFGPEGKVYVSDVARHFVAVLDTMGRLVDTLHVAGLRYPYLAGWRGDTLVVLAPEARQLVGLVGHQVVRRIPLPDQLPAKALLYAAASKTGYFVKALRDGETGWLLQLDALGQTLRQQRLSGPVWRYAGLLRLWDDTLLSLSGFRPVVDRWYPDGRMDTLALVGFDSPMLARSRAFLVGEAYQAPLLSSAAVPVDSLLFVLNLRPGWVQVDVYDTEGWLRYRLAPTAQPLKRQFYPHDLAVRCKPTACLLVVVLNDPDPRVVAYSWQLVGNSRTP